MLAEQGLPIPPPNPDPVVTIRNEHREARRLRHAPVRGATDLHAALLAMMGLDHEQLTCRYAGRDFRLTHVIQNDRPMKSLGDGLPPEIARQLHSEWRKNEAEYWAVRDHLLGRYQGQWIGFAGGAVVASGTRPVVVFHAAHQLAAHPFIICVGCEDEPYRMRRASFPYDTRDVLNSLEVLFRGPSGEIVINP